MLFVTDGCLGRACPALANTSSPPLGLGKLGKLAAPGLPGSQDADHSVDPHPSDPCRLAPPPLRTDRLNFNSDPISPFHFRSIAREAVSVADRIPAMRLSRIVPQHTFSLRNAPATFRSFKGRGRKPKKGSHRYVKAGDRKSQVPSPGRPNSNQSLPFVSLHDGKGEQSGFPVITFRKSC